MGWVGGAPHPAYVDFKASHLTIVRSRLLCYSGRPDILGVLVQDVTSQEVQTALRDLVEDGFVRTSGQGMGMLITRNQ
jgi:hypothetical protein